jgi:carboxypeptidase Q
MIGICVRMVILCTFILSSQSVLSQEKVYWDVVQKIRDEGFKRSKVLETASYLTDVYGPRLAHSPSYNAAAEWAKSRLEGFGLENVHLEKWGEFGLGWENEYTSVHMIKPRYMPIIAYPNSWTSGTNGKIKGQAVHIAFLELEGKEDLDEFRGKMKNAIVFTAPERKMHLNFNPDAKRYTEEDLDELAETTIIVPGGGYELNVNLELERGLPGLTRTQIMEFFLEEGAAAFVSTDRDGDDGTVYVYGRPLRSKDEKKPPPMLTMAAEHYNRIIRILEKDIPVEMEVEIRSRFYEDELQDYNVVAEIPGTDLSDELVMLGGHFDAASAGTGATDNAAGSSVVMEAVRILKAIGVKPRRTIRAVLWGAEELGLWGSRGYVSGHFGDRNTMELKPAHENFSTYFNYDNGTGRIRGIYLQNHELVRPIFMEWMKPFNDLGMTHIAPGYTGGTDHLSFNEVGLPGFQFIQDPLEYGSRTHHSNMDVYDRLQEEDLMQASVIMAGFVYHAAMRDAKFPRKKLPAPREK